jgi:hypothetical protein
MHKLLVACALAFCLELNMSGQTPPTPQAGQIAPNTPSGNSKDASLEDSFPLDKFTQFSAIMVGGPIPGTEDEIHIYRSGNLMRMEGNEGKSYQITDLDKNETHGITKRGCLRYASPYIRSYPFSFSNPKNKFERVPVGKETVDGHTCQVEDVIVTLPGRSEPAKIRLWEADDLQGFPVKIETRTHRVIRYKNVVLGPQDPTLFIFPNVCQVAEQTIGNHP